MSSQYFRILNSNYILLLFDYSSVFIRLRFPAKSTVQTPWQKASLKWRCQNSTTDQCSQCQWPIIDDSLDKIKLALSEFVAVLSPATCRTLNVVCIIKLTLCTVNWIVHDESMALTALLLLCVNHIQQRGWERKIVALARVSYTFVCPGLGRYSSVNYYRWFMSRV